MHVTHAHSHLLQVVGEIFRHALGQCRHEHSLTLSFTQPDFVQQIVHLPLHRTHLEHRIEQTGRTNHLFNHDPLGQLQLQLTGRRRHIDQSRRQLHELFKYERAIVQRTWQTEPIIHEREFARPVTVVHAPDLWQRDMRFVDHHEVVVGEVIKQTRRTFAGDATADVPRVVLDARTRSDFQQHLDIEICALFETLGFQQLALGLELFKTRREFVLDCNDGAFDSWTIGDEMLGRIDRRAFQCGNGFARQRIDLGDTLDFIAPQFHAQRLFFVCWKNFHRIAAHTKRSTFEVHVIALILNAHQRAQHIVTSDTLSDIKRHHSLAIRHGIAKPVDRRHGRHDHHIVALHQ